MKGNRKPGVLMKKNISLAVFILSVIVFLFAISGRRASPLPGDAVHARPLDAAFCSTCHAQGRQAPLKATHPPREQCLVCHTSSKTCHPFPGGD